MREAEAQAIRVVAQAMHEHGNPAQYLITTRYIESLRDMTRTQQFEGDFYAGRDFRSSVERWRN